jgi:hypothetical protein
MYRYGSHQLAPPSRSLLLRSRQWFTLFLPKMVKCGDLKARLLAKHRRRRRVLYREFEFDFTVKVEQETISRLVRAVPKVCDTRGGEEGVRYPL